MSNSVETRCRSRTVSTGHYLYFGDGKHRFYLESRCPNEKLEDRLTCARCIIKVISKHQYTSNYQHGMIHEPIPPHSHLYGGVWYEENARKWGAPTEEDLAHAILLQKKAQMDPSKVISPTIILPKKMRRKNATTVPLPLPLLPPTAPLTELTISTDIPEIKPTVKKNRRPVAKKLSPMAPIPVESSTYPPSTSLPILTLFQPQEEQEQEQKEDQKEQDQKEDQKEQDQKEDQKRKKKKKEPKEKKVTKKSTKPSPYEKLIHTHPVVHKDSCIPTHKEETIEEHDIQDYETEEVVLSIFILDGTVYFKDSKNKLYRRIKEKTIGQYVGRYDPSTDSLVTHIPDSDDEDEDHDQ